MWICHDSKVTRRLIAFVAIILLFLMLLTGCDPYASIAPYNTASKWICEDPEIVLSYWRDENGVLQEKSWIIWDGEEIDIIAGFHSGSIMVTLNKPSVPTQVLFQGKWKYKGDKLIFTIEEDNFFGGAYKTLIFSKGE